MVEQDDSGDYGYDLANEARSAKVLPLPNRRYTWTGLRGTGMDTSTDGDLGYDMAHEG
jgi:hypothetical protein